jgi:hypothetical protein
MCNFPKDGTGITNSKVNTVLKLIKIVFSQLYSTYRQFMAKHLLWDNKHFVKMLLKNHVLAGLSNTLCAAGRF